jgi:hypothetical protein
MDEKLKTDERDVSIEIKENADSIVEKFEQDGKTPVITNKQESATAPSGDPHDYVSSTRYKMWRNENGNLAWDDGMSNPEADRYRDAKKVEEFKVAMFYTTEAAIEAASKDENAERYSNYINTALSKWFVEEETRMTPNLEYAQVINGETTGQYFGIIEGTDFLFILEQVERLQQKDLIKPEVLEGIKEWYGNYLGWLTTSEKGKREMEKENNHGTWYEAQVAGIADFLGNEDEVLGAIEITKKRMDSQITQEGDMPLEKERADSYGYPLYNLSAYSKIASVAEKYGQDLWNYTSEKGSSLKKAFEYYANSLPGENLHPIPDERDGQMYVTFRLAAKAYNKPEYYELPKRYFPDSVLADEVIK